MLRDVGDPQLVGCIRGEHAFDAVLEHRRQPPDPPVRHFRWCTPCNTISAARTSMHIPNLVDQVRILDVSTRRPAGSPLVITRSRDLPDPARHRDGHSVIGEFTNEPEAYFVRCPETRDRSAWTTRAV
ncbi:hypothetical protein GCM10017714_22680 [Curtobacterium pusillum]|nr:hypothetical protein GCM10017610_26840 [Curtobacterium pusillum]